jgi:hypothetical protein
MIANAWRRGVAAGLVWVAAAGANPGPGDIAIVAVNTDDTDSFAWVALRGIPSNTVIHFTDSSVSNGWFRWTEHLGGIGAGPLNWSSTESVTEGTVIRWDGLDFEWSVGEATGVAPGLSASGDQLIAYTGSINSNALLYMPWCGDPGGAQMLFAINIANGGWNEVTGGTTETSYVPPGLATNAGTALHLGAQDNACYVGPRRGTVEELRRAMAASTNWATSNEPYEATLWPVTFEIVRTVRGTRISMR